MTPSTDLHTLIRSLDKKEKAWFRSWCGERGAETIYMQVFDVIVRQRVYDESALKAHFRGQSFLTRLPAVKNYLFAQLLDALCVLHLANNTAANTAQHLHGISLLVSKGMVNVARKRIERLYPKLLEQDLFLQALETVSLHKSLLRRIAPPQMEAEMERLMKQEHFLLMQYANLSAYQLLSDRFDLQQRRRLTPRLAKEEQVFRSILREPLLRNVKQARSFEALYFFHRLNANCNMMLGNLRKTMDHRRKLANLFEALPAPTALQVSKFSGVLYDLGVSYRDLHQTDEALAIVRRIMALPVHYPQFRSENNKTVVFKRSAILESDTLYNAGLFVEGVQRVAYWERNLTKYADFIEKDLELILQYNIALLYYGDGKLGKALHWINRIINEHEHDYVQDVVCFARIFRLFIHIDKGNDELIGSIARSTFSYLKRRQRLYATEHLLLDFAGQIGKSLTREKQMGVFRLLLKQLEQLRNNRFEKAALDYFDCISWLHAQLSGKSFAEVFREQLANRTR